MEEKEKKHILLKVLSFACLLPPKIAFDSVLMISLPPISLPMEAKLARVGRCMSTEINSMLIFQGDTL